MPFTGFIYIMLIAMGLGIVAPNNICHDYSYYSIYHIPEILELVW